MLKGLDISHYNKNMKDIRTINKYDFIIMKATEGATYRDPALSFYMSILDKKVLKGFYHFARPENRNTAKAEASNFLSSILKYIDGRTLIALDVEAGALKFKDLDKWVYDFCKHVYDVTGIRPLIYCSEAECYRFKKAAELGCGLWVAKWSLTKPSKNKIKPWKFWAIWQKSDREIVSGVRCDLDLFNGTREQYIKYCMPEDEND